MASKKGRVTSKAARVRARYVAALRAADDHNIEPLLEFARS